MIQRFTGRLVNVDVHPGLNAWLRVRQKIANVRFNQHGLKPRLVEQLLGGHPWQSLEDSILFSRLTTLRIRLNETDNFVVLGRPINRQFGRVRVRGPELPDSDL